MGDQINESTIRNIVLWSFERYNADVYKNELKIILNELKDDTSEEFKNAHNWRTILQYLFCKNLD